MPNYIVSVDMIIAAENEDEAHVKGSEITDALKKSGQLEYFLLAPNARPVVTPDKD